MAGESAEDLARRQRERAERLMRSAQMYERGADGERTTGAILDALGAQGWAVFHDVKWPGRVRANIDHVAVGPPGVYIIDSKNWAGRIEVRDNTFRCNGRRQDKTVASAGDAALAVAGLLSAPAAATARSVLCFVRDEPVAGWCHDVMVCSTGNLREMLLTRPTALTPDQVRMAAIELDIMFRAAADRSAAPGADRRTVARPPAMAAPRGTMPRPSRAAPAQRRKKKSVAGQLVGLCVFLLLAMVLLSQLPRLASLGDVVARALVPQPATSYGNCGDLHEDYPAGVGTSVAVARWKGAPHRPTADQAVYSANASLDLDHDGLACERKQRSAHKP